MYDYDRRSSLNSIGDSAILAAKPKWQEKLQALLDHNPLWMLSNNRIVCSTCKSPEDRGKKLTLRQVVNYGWNTCSVCNKHYM
jgi:hypothetical protein